MQLLVCTFIVKSPYPLSSVVYQTRRNQGVGVNQILPSPCDIQFLSETFVTVRRTEQGVVRSAHRVFMYRGADKSVARPGRKQADVSVRMA